RHTRFSRDWSSDVCSSDLMILDEAQAIKNHLTQTAKATRQIQAKQRFALSGTPIENRLEELWSIFQTISPGFLGPKKEFIQYPRSEERRVGKECRPRVPPE